MGVHYERLEKAKKKVEGRDVGEERKCMVGGESCREGYEGEKDVKCCTGLHKRGRRAVDRVSKATLCRGGDREDEDKIAEIE